MRINKINNTVLAQEVKDDINSKVSEVVFSNTKTDIQNMIDDINNNLGTIRKPPVLAYEDLATTYPNPQQGWLVKVEDSGLHYQYDEAISDWYVTTMNPVPTASPTTDGLLKKEDKEKLDSIEINAQVNRTAEELLNDLKSIDGHNSGLDADLLDGRHADEFALDNHNHDGVYYRKNEVDVRLNSKANSLALTNHESDNNIHTSSDEKDIWNQGIIKIGTTPPASGFLFWLDTNN